MRLRETVVAVVAVVQCHFHGGQLEESAVTVVQRILRQTELWLSWAVPPMTEGNGCLQVELLKRKMR